MNKILSTCLGVTNYTPLKLTKKDHKAEYSRNREIYMNPNGTINDCSYYCIRLIHCKKTIYC